MRRRRERSKDRSCGCRQAEDTALSEPDPACGISPSLSPREDEAALNLHVVMLGAAERSYSSWEPQFLAGAALP